jgi:hypothetical protein
VNHALRLVRGPVGRRAVVAVGVAGLLITALVATEGGDARPASGRPAPASRRTSAQTGRLADASVTAPAAAVTTGTQLLTQAASATRQVSYQGVQVISWLAPGDGSAWLGPGPSQVSVDVSHQPGQAPDVVLGLSPTLVGLLRSHYTVIYTGEGSAAGRPAAIVEVVRHDGSLAARFWLDQATKLPLRRELFDTRARLISLDDFSGLKIATPSATRSAAPSSRPAGHRPTGSRAPANPAAASPAPAAGTMDRTMITGAAIRMSDAMSLAGVSTAPLTASHQPAPTQPWSDRLSAAQLAGMRASGWPVPAAMPAGLTLFNASESTTSTGPVVDLAYSDGLSVVSVFVQQGRLPATLPGWHQTDLSGHPLYLRNPAEPNVTWSSDGYVFTVVAGAPATVLASVVDSLPHQAKPGFWGRMDRGARRLLSWINPFH